MLELVYKIPSMCILLTVSPQVDPEKKHREHDLNVLYGPASDAGLHIMCCAD